MAGERACVACVGHAWQEWGMRGRGVGAWHQLRHAWQEGGMLGKTDCHCSGW